MMNVNQKKEEEINQEEEKNRETGETQGAGETQEAQTDSVTLSREEYEKVLNHIKELEALKDKFMRSAADFENAKKRLAKEKEEYLKFGQEKLIQSLLPVLDNFERALSHAGTTSAEDEGGKQYKGLLSGIRMVHKQLVDIMKNQGLTRLEVINKPFDPHKHEAIAHIPGEGPEDEIIEEIEAGYMLHDRLLRAAKVNVRAAPGDTGA